MDYTPSDFLYLPFVSAILNCTTSNKKEWRWYNTKPNHLHQTKTNVMTNDKHAYSSKTVKLGRLT